MVLRVSSDVRIMTPLMDSWSWYTDLEISTIQRPARGAHFVGPAARRIPRRTVG